MVASNYRATVQYDGTDYSGFQIQPDKRTIQGELERALQRVTQQFVRVAGAGRTDAGVHALGQVISFRANWSHGDQDLQRAMNAVLPGDISLGNVAVADDRFHARFSALSRAYVYTIYNGPVRAPLLSRFTHHVERPLDLNAMAEAASELEGEHDFAAFGHPPVGDSTVRIVYRVGWRAGVPVWGNCFASDCRKLLRFEIEANAFLRRMVRRIVGTLLLVGGGSLSPAAFSEILESREIRRAGPPVPGSGLCLWRVGYDGDERQDRLYGTGRDRRHVDSDEERLLGDGGLA